MAYTQITCTAVVSDEYAESYEQALNDLLDKLQERITTYSGGITTEPVPKPDNADEIAGS